MRTRRFIYSALLTFLLAAAHPLSASIDYTPVHKVLDNGSTFTIDFNHDGSKEFSLNSTSKFGLCDLRLPGLTGNVKLAPGNSTAEVILKNGYAAALPAGVSVGPAQSYYLGTTSLIFFTPCRSVSGNWYNVSNHYLGVKFSVAGQIHYGWIEVSVNVNQGNFTMSTVVVGFAYETVPGKAIVTGQTGTPNACSLPSTDQTVHICMPAAGSTVSSPVAITAKVRWDGHTINHIRIYMDNADRFDLTSPVGGSVSTSLTLSSGNHHLVVTAWDTTGHSIQSGETFTVQ